MYGRMRRKTRFAFGHSFALSRLSKKRHQAVLSKTISNEVWRSVKATPFLLNLLKALS